MASREEYPVEIESLGHERRVSAAAVHAAAGGAPVTAAGAAGGAASPARPAERNMISTACSAPSARLADILYSIDTVNKTIKNIILYKNVIISNVSFDQLYFCIDTDYHYNSNTIINTSNVP